MAYTAGPAARHRYLVEDVNAVAVRHELIDIDSFRSADGWISFDVLRTELGPVRPPAPPTIIGDVIHRHVFCAWGVVAEDGDIERYQDRSSSPETLRGPSRIGFVSPNNSSRSQLERICSNRSKLKGVEFRGMATALAWAGEQIESLPKKRAGNAPLLLLPPPPSLRSSPEEVEDANRQLVRVHLHDPFGAILFLDLHSRQADGNQVTADSLLAFRPMAMRNQVVRAGDRIAGPTFPGSAAALQTAIYDCKAKSVIIKHQFVWTPRGWQRSEAGPPLTSKPGRNSPQTAAQIAAVCEGRGLDKSISGFNRVDDAFASIF